MKTIKVLSFLLVLSINTFAQTSKSELGGFWDVGTSWIGGTFPGSATATTITAVTKTITVDGTIKSNKNVTLNASGLTINAGDTVVILGDLNLILLASVTNNGVLVVMGNVTNGASTIVNNGKMVTTGNYTNALGANTFSGPSYVYGTTSGFLFAPAVSSKANLISNDVALYNWINLMNIALPIELLSFEVSEQNGTASLSWATASEFNNDYFTIERSSNGKTFEKVGTVKGNGNSKTTITYSFIDNQPNSGTNYYKLTQTDYDGKTESFKVVFVDIQKAKGISIYPNPTTEYLYITNTTDYSTYNIKDAKGLSVNNDTELSTADAGKTKINVNALKPGVYYLELTNGGNASRFRFVKN